MLHSFTRFMSQNRQSFSDCLSLACLKRPPRCGSLDHLADAVDIIDHRPLIDDHVQTLKERVPTKQPQGSDEEWASHTLVPGVVSIESSETSQHLDHRYGTP
jgi:hypothetical protein